MQRRICFLCSALCLSAAVQNFHVHQFLWNFMMFLSLNPEIFVFNMFGLLNDYKLRLPGNQESDCLPFYRRFLADQ